MVNTEHWLVNSCISFTVTLKLELFLEGTQISSETCGCRGCVNLNIWWLCWNICQSLRVWRIGILFLLCSLTATICHLSNDSIFVVLITIFKILGMFSRKLAPRNLFLCFSWWQALSTSRVVSILLVSSMIWFVVDIY